jgi:hypothetical protein
VKPFGTVSSTGQTSRNTGTSPPRSEASSGTSARVRAAETDTELPDAGLLGRSTQRRQRGHTGSGQRRTRVRGPQLTVDERDPQHTRLGTGRVGRVLGELDQQAVPVATEPQVFLGVRVFAEAGRRTAPRGKDRGAQGLGTERVGHSETSRTSSCASS